MTHHAATTAAAIPLAAVATVLVVPTAAGCPDHLRLPGFPHQCRFAAERRGYPGEYLSAVCFWAGVAGLVAAAPTRSGIRVGLRPGIWALVAAPLPLRRFYTVPDFAEFRFGSRARTVAMLVVVVIWCAVPGAAVPGRWPDPENSFWEYRSGPVRLVVATAVIVNVVGWRHALHHVRPGIPVLAQTHRDAMPVLALAVLFAGERRPSAGRCPRRSPRHHRRDRGRCWSRSPGQKASPPTGTRCPDPAKHQLHCGATMTPAGASTGGRRRLHWGPVAVLGRRTGGNHPLTKCFADHRNLPWAPWARPTCWQVLHQSRRPGGLAHRAGGHCRCCRCSTCSRHCWASSRDSTYRSCSSPGRPDAAVLLLPGAAIGGPVGAGWPRWWPGPSPPSWRRRRPAGEHRRALSTDVLRGRVRDFRLAAIVGGVIPIPLALAASSLEVVPQRRTGVRGGRTTLCPPLVLDLVARPDCGGRDQRTDRGPHSPEPLRHWRSPTRSTTTPPAAGPPAWSAIRGHQRFGDLLVMVTVSRFTCGSSGADLRASSRGCTSRNGWAWAGASPHRDVTVHGTSTVRRIGFPFPPPQRPEMFRCELVSIGCGHVHQHILRSGASAVSTYRQSAGPHRCAVSPPRPVRIPGTWNQIGAASSFR